VKRSMLEESKQAKLTDFFTKDKENYSEIRSKRLLRSVGGLLQTK